MRLLRSATLALALGLAGLPFAPAPGNAAIAVSITVAPPPIPVYVQPPIPGPGYHWIPGYWAWGDDDYYWVPGYWERPPRIGVLWTPGYWGWVDGVYIWHTGYWGPTVGFYGGINYGFGYGGIGFAGGYWRGSNFFYNTSVTNVTVNITNVYARPVPNTGVTRVAYNGGNGGVTARPTPQQIAAAKKGIPPTTGQVQHVNQAAVDPGNRAKANHGVPTKAAVSTPGGNAGAGNAAGKGAPNAGVGNTAGKGTPGVGNAAGKGTPGTGNAAGKGAPNAGAVNAVGKGKVNTGAPGAVNKPNPAGGKNNAGVMKTQKPKPAAMHAGNPQKAARQHQVAKRPNIGGAHAVRPAARPAARAPAAHAPIKRKPGQ